MKSSIAMFRWIFWPKEIILHTVNSNIPEVNQKTQPVKQNSIAISEYTNSPFKPWYITGRILPLHCIRARPITLWNYPQWQKSIRLIHWHPGGSSDSIKPIDRCIFDIYFMPGIYVFCMFHLPFWLTLYHRRTREISRGTEKEMAWKSRVEIKIAIFLSDLGPYTWAPWSALTQRGGILSPPPPARGYDKKRS